MVKDSANSKTLAYFAAFISLGLFAAALGPSLPSLAEQTHTSLQTISLIFIARSLGFLIGSFRGGRFYDRQPSHRIMVLFLFVMGSALALAPLAGQFWVLGIILLVLGLGEGVLDIGANLMIVWVHGRHSTPFLNGLHFFFGLGSFLAPLIVAPLILATGSLHLAYWILAFYAVPVALWISRLASPAVPSGISESGDHNVDYRLIFLISTFFFLYVGAEVGFGNWIYTYSLTLKLGDIVRSAYLTSAFWGALTAGRLFGVAIAIRMRPRSILSIDLLGCLISLGIIFLFQNSYSFTLLGTFGLGFSMASIYPTTLAFAARHMTASGKITRWFFVGGSIGGMFLPWLIGQLFDAVGPGITLYALLVDLLLALLVFAGMLIRSRHLDLHQG